uniref:non-chaperonin molecular chaperone ATPase n=1 Tax=Sinocyclocheilus anshuiensis TaxID=1608454 RepID=A0A671PFI6_9TELE
MLMLIIPAPVPRSSSVNSSLMSCGKSRTEPALPEHGGDPAEPGGDPAEPTEDKAPQRWRSYLAQMSVNTMKTLNICIGRPVLISSSVGQQQVCVAWPVSQFPGRRVGLQSSAQSALRVTSGSRVTVQPITGALLQAEHLRLTLRPEDKVLNTEEFRNYLLRTLDGRVLLPGGSVCVSYFGRQCVLAVDSVTGVDGETLRRSDGVAPSHDPSPLTPDPSHDPSPLTPDRSHDPSPLTPDPSHDPSPLTPDRSHDPSPLTPDRSHDPSPLTPVSTPCKLTDPVLSPSETSDRSGRSSTDTFYAVCSSSTLSVCDPGEQDEAEEGGEGSKVTYSMIGGLGGQLQVIRETIELPLKHPELFRNYGIPPPRGLLLYGPPGTGKTMIGRAVANEVGAHMSVINGPEIMSKFYGETEGRLRQIFSQASQRQPAIIFIDELDALCPRREGAQNEVEKRLVATLLTLMDGIGSEGHSGQLLVLGATNRPHALDPALRRPGRFDKELEIGVPGADGRMDILQKQLRSMPCDVSAAELRELADAAHGYVGADLAAVCKEAGLHALRRVLGSKPVLSDVQVMNSVKVMTSDLRLAMTEVKPSAMREVAIDVPKVRWSDIGGMEEVKLALKQAVEWPLRHPEAFSRLGITPPKGVLLYGPPGCSKTMIAKALANESQLNFLSIKVHISCVRMRMCVCVCARTVAPSIVFFDEIDALAAARGSSGHAGGVADRVLAQLLTEMDGIEQLKDVTVLAALMRPGRLDRIIFVPLPDADTRREIFTLQLRSMPIHPSVHLEDLVTRTERYSGAEITAVCREAALQALQEDITAQHVSAGHFDSALNTIRPRIPQTLLQTYTNYQQKHGGSRV